MTLLALLDVVLAVGFSLRLTRLIVADDLGRWYVREPLLRRYDPYADIGHEDPRWFSQRLVSGLNCPYCVGFWLGVLVLASLALVGGPSAGSGTAEVWRWVAGAFALNEVVAGLAVALGATADGEDGDDDEDGQP